MRRVDEVVEVSRGLVGHEEGPAEFRWRGRRWRVRQLQTSWVETVDWWNSVDVRAARGEQLDELSGAAAGDLLAEEELWRVEAEAERSGRVGVYELAHRWSDGSWRIRGVLD
ncbi:hypothetical protein GC722_14965 [Auraticoccus sp. F435]|uniref:DUF6504 domain-containing protein n=1 Tax=Auraticoccus cholistanensis TaxID=2656650 RepID=A0A6A9UZ95_9ACTN|nr:hypothetical protein [Auraticoccus cholistanensis]